MKSKTSKFISKIIPLLSSVIMFIYIKIAQAINLGEMPDTQVLYGPFGLMACGDDKWCLFLYRHPGLKIAYILVQLVLVIGVIFVIVKFIRKIIRKKRQSKNIQQQKPTNEVPK